MSMPAWVPEAWSQLNEDKQKQAGAFLRSLLSQQRDEQQAQSSGFPFGILKGKIEVADNFDDPLPGLEDYT